MSEESSDRGWIAVLVVMVLITAGCVVGYFLAPFEAPPAKAADTAAPGLVAPEYRIAAITTDGALVVLDRRDGSVSEIVRRSGFDGTVIDVGHEVGAAYVSGTEPTTEIRSVSLRTGTVKHLATGGHVAVGPIAYPELDRNIERPAADQMAFVVRVDGQDAIEVQNLVTGSTARIAAATADPRIQSIVDLAWSPLDNRLFGIADDGSLLFTLAADQVTAVEEARAPSLDEATTASPPGDIDRWVDGTAWGTTFAVIGRTSDGGSRIVEVDRKTLEPVDTLFDAPAGTELTTVTSDPTRSALLATTADGDLLEIHPSDTSSGRDAEVTTLAKGIVRVAAGAAG